ncbi:MAG: 4-hydroxy-tetrahydrodipicolinate synthase [bacterium]|nr:4-hydroxy-tetrahydrodipicolinate synthase [bacterium]
MGTAKLGRLLTAMVTPFDKDMKVDYGMAGDLAERLVAEGSDGIVVAGTTGESPTLTREEKLRLFKTVVDRVGGKARVVAGTGNNSTEASVSLSREAADLGIDAVMLVTPYYNKPSQEGLYRHFKAVAEAIELPVILYNVPGRTGINLEASTVIRLSAVDNITAVKEASKNLEQVAEIAAGVPDDFDIYSGDDGITLPVMSVGGVGIISIASHVAGPEIKTMVEAYASGDHAAALKLHLRLIPLFKVLFIATNPAPVKAAVRMRGMDVGRLRLPLVDVDADQEKLIIGVMKELGQV